MNRNKNHKKVSTSVVAVFTALVFVMSTFTFAFADDSKSNLSKGENTVSALQVADATNSQAKKGGYRSSSHVNTAPINDADYTDEIGSLATLPASYRSPYITPVKDQGIYGNCYAFAVLGSAEGSLIRNKLATKETAKLSPFQLGNAIFNQWTFFTKPSKQPSTNMVL